MGMKDLEREIEELKKEMTEKEILAMLENSLLCEKCWGRMIRTLEHEPFFTRLLKFYNGKYNHNYHPYAIKRLQQVLDTLEKKKCLASQKELEAENDRLKRLETELGKVLKDLAKAEVKRKDGEGKQG